MILGDQLEMRMDALCGLCVKHAASWGSAAAKGHVCVAVVGSMEQETGFSEQTRRADGDADSVNAVHQRVPLVVGMEGFQDTRVNRRSMLLSAALRTRAHARTRTHTHAHARKHAQTCDM